MAWSGVMTEGGGSRETKKDGRKEEKEECGKRRGLWASGRGDLLGRDFARRSEGKAMASPGRRSHERASASPSAIQIATHPTKPPSKTISVTITTLL